jgi:hypothetical protein
MVLTLRKGPGKIGGIVYPYLVLLPRVHKIYLPSSIKVGRAFQIESRQKTGGRFSEFGSEMENIKLVLIQAPKKISWRNPSLSSMTSPFADDLKTRSSSSWGMGRLYGRLDEFVFLLSCQEVH